MRDGKKVLLILGSLAVMKEIVENAKASGYYVIVTDYLADSPVKRLADESWMLSIDDVDGIVAKARQAGVDGVMNYCIDPGQKPYQQICKKLGLPCVADFEQFDIMTNKDKFKQTCKEYGIGYIPYYEIDETMRPEDLAKIEYPVMVKPADSRASKGIRVVEREEDLADAISYALSFSKRKKFLVEKYMVDCPETIVKYVACDGELFLTSMSDVFACIAEDGTKVYMGTQTYPFRYFDEYLQTTHERVKAMLRGIGIRNGAVSLTGFYDNGVFRFFDPSLRMGGAQDWRVVNAICGIDISSLLTNFAVTGSMGDVEAIRPIDCCIADKASALLYFDLRPGKIAKFEGIEEVTKIPGVVGYHQCHVVGDEVSGYGTSDNVAIRFILSCKNKEELAETMLEAQKYIRIEDAQGRNLIVSPFDVRKLRG